MRIPETGRQLAGRRVDASAPGSSWPDAILTAFDTALHGRGDRADHRGGRHVYSGKCGSPGRVPFRGARFHRWMSARSGSHPTLSTTRPMTHTHWRSGPAGRRSSIAATCAGTDARRRCSRDLWRVRRATWTHCFWKVRASAGYPPGTDSRLKGTLKTPWPSWPRRLGARFLFVPPRKTSIELLPCFARHAARAGSW